WIQEYPTDLVLKFQGAPRQILRAGNAYLSDIARHNTRIPAGHPEAFIEAFANIYRNAGRTIAAKIAGEKPGPFDTDFPTVQDGAIGVHFIQKAVESGKRGGWVDARYTPPGA